MKYAIWSGGKVIAVFSTCQYRDECLGRFEETWPDVCFESGDV